MQPEDLKTRAEKAESDNAALREDNAELNEAIKGWEAAERSWTEIRAGMECDNAALRARVERLEAARDEMSKHMIVGLPDGNLQCMFCETIYPNEQMYLRELELTDKMGDQEAELATLRAQLAEAQAREAVLVGALTRISKSRLLDMDTLHPDACPSLAAETLANIPEATKAMGEVIEAAEAVANEFAQQHPLIKTLRTNLARLHAGRGA